MSAVVIAIAVFATTSAEPIRKKATWENCGPPIEKFVIHPNPPRLRQEFNSTVEFVAAHDMLAGTIEFFVNAWPYHAKVAYCDDGKTFDGKGCLIKKGEKRVISESTWINDSFQEMEYHGNITVTNRFNQVMMCIRVSFTVYD